MPEVLERGLRGRDMVVVVGVRQSFEVVMFVAARWWRRGQRGGLESAGAPDDVVLLAVPTSACQSAVGVYLRKVLPT
jgi:predicted dinucleotide-binding enzyme